MISILAGAVLATAGSLGVGRAAWRRQPPHWTYALACGAPLLSLAIYLCLLLHVAAPTVLVMLCLAAAAPLLRSHQILRWTRPPWLALVFLPFAVLYAVNALAPPIQPDAVTYHLGLPAEWLRLHGFAPRIGFYEMLPLGLETLFVPAIAVGGYSAASLFHLLLLGATVPLLWHTGQLLGLSREAAAGASALYALAPVVGISGSTAYNDDAAVFFGVAVFALLVEDWFAPSPRWLAVAGLAAGFCYAIKVTGLLVVAAGFVWILWRRRWRGAALFLAAALLSILPWMGRDLWLTGDPLAPLGNHLFPNDFFHTSLEDILGQKLRNYGSTWRQVPWAATVDGLDLQGLLGPVFLLLPLALLALRKPAGRVVLAVALLLTLPWTQNLGARFLMPALPFYALALAFALPRGVFLMLVLLHALSAWPPVTERYANQWAWRLKEIPWAAALRNEPEDNYLTKNLEEYRFLQQASRHLPPNQPLLDLYALPYAYLPTAPTGPLPTAAVDNMTETLALCAERLPEPLYPLRCTWPLKFIRALRVRMEARFESQWSISEVALERQGRTLPISRNWFLNAWPEPGDAWMAIDGNTASRWRSWSTAQPGMFWELRFDRPVPLDAIRVQMANVNHPGIVAVYLQGLDRQWRRVSDGMPIGAPSMRFHREAAARFVKERGLPYLVVPIGGSGHGPLGESLIAHPDAWGVDLVERVGPIGLFKIR